MLNGIEVENKFLKNLLNKPKEFKPGQVWLLKRDSDEYLPIEVVLTDSQYTDKIGIVRGAALSRVNNGGDTHDVILNKKNYPDTFPNGRVCLRLTDCAFPKDKLEFFIDELTKSDWNKVKQSLNIKDSFHTEAQLELVGSLIERLSLFRSEATALYEKWLDSQNKILLLVILSIINKTKTIRSYYRLTGSSLDETISLDELWSKVEKNKDKAICLFEDKILIVDFIMLDNLPHLIFYSSVKSTINSIELTKGNRTVKSADVEFSIIKDGKFITPLDPSLLEAGEWILKFNINKEQKTILLRIE
jgi:hypothetical protein